MDQALNTFDVVCFGEILWDFFEAEAPGPEPAARIFRREIGGASANVAVGLARLGVTSAVAGGVGNDRLGLALKHVLESERVATDFVMELPNRTGITFVVRDPEGEPQFLPYRDASADLAITAARVTSAMGRTKWGVVGSNTLLTPALTEATQRFVDLVRANAGLVFVDLNVRTHLWPDKDEMWTRVARLVEGADVVKASEADLAAVGGLSFLQANARAATCILTRGGRGAEVVGDCGHITVPTTRVHAVDATGAGDAFIAGVLAVLVNADARRGQTIWADANFWTRALEVGNLMGARAVGSVGAVTGLTGLDDVREKILTSSPGSASHNGT